MMKLVKKTIDSSELVLVSNNPGRPVSLEIWRRIYWESICGVVGDSVRSQIWEPVRDEIS